MLKSAELDIENIAARDDRDDGVIDKWFLDVLRIESEALEQFMRSAPPGIAAIVQLIAAEKRPIVCMGIGKSGLVAAKLAATFSSLGTSAFFLNAAEAAHGDLGAIQTENVVILFSNSGATEEILRILPLLKARGCRLIGIVGRPDSPLGRSVEHRIVMDVRHEADHIGMAPTASTTLQMAIGDALAVAVSQARNFTREDFLGHHPAGLLGRHLIPIRHLMHKDERLPVVRPDASVADILAVISSKRLGGACVVDAGNRLLGLIVDGDIRRLIQARQDLYQKTAADVMQSRPRVISDCAIVADVLLMLQENEGRYVLLPVVDGDRRLQGILHTYDLLQAQPAGQA